MMQSAGIAERKIKRRSILPSAVFLAAALGVFSIGLGEDADEAAKPARRECRLIINWDQANMTALQLTYAHRTKEPSAESVKALVENIVDEHAKAKVDRIVQCVFALSLGTVPPGFKSFDRDVIRDNLYENRPTGFRQLEEAGYDLLQLQLDRAHRHGIEFLGGLRMNDRHRASTPFHDAHPEWQLREFPGAMDYKHAGVRNAVLAFAKEFLDRYDVDGLELDWMRWCHVFRPTEAEQNAPLLTDFIGEIRGLLDQTARKRGHDRLLLGVRIPQTLQECRALGFDVAAWVRNGAVDYICPSDFFYTDLNIRTEDFVALTKETKCKVYPSVHPLIARGNDHHVHSAESYRAAAKNYYSFGADGISVYNYQYHWRSDLGSEDEWPRALSYLTGLRDREDVARGTRHYLFHTLWAGYSQSGDRKDGRIVLDRKSNPPSGSLDFRLAEDRDEAIVSATLRFKVTAMEAADELVVALNGETIPREKIQQTLDADGQSAQEGRVLPAFTLIQFPLKKSSPVKFGDNRLTVSLQKSEGRENAVVQELEVMVGEIK